MLSVISVIVSIPASIASAMAIYAFIAKPFKELNDKLDQKMAGLNDKLDNKMAGMNDKLDEALARLNKFEGRFQQSDADNARKTFIQLTEERDRRGGP